MNFLEKIYFGSPPFSTKFFDISLWASALPEAVQRSILRDPQ